MAKAPKAETEEVAAEAPAAAPRSRKKRVIIAAAIVLLAGGAAGWMLLGGKSDGSAQARVEEKKKPVGPPVFLPLEPFIVNLQPQASSQFLQVDVTLRVADQRVVDELKALMPEVRDRVLRLLATKNAQELTAPGGRDKLAEAVRDEVTFVIDPDAVKKPAAPAVTREPAEPELPAEPSADVEEEPAAAGEAAAAETAAAEDERKIRSVLFTSFIIQ